jgi:hypothetical protein
VHLIDLARFQAEPRSVEANAGRNRPKRKAIHENYRRTVDGAKCTALSPQFRCQMTG